MRLIYSHHDAGLIVQFFISSPNPKLGRKIPLGYAAEKVAAVSRETVMRFSPEICFAISRDRQNTSFKMPISGFVEPSALLQHDVFPELTPQRSRQIAPMRLRRPAL